jgi:hypothetical protein
LFADKLKLNSLREELAEDLLRGVDAIAEYIGDSTRRTYYKLERGYLPAGKEGATWIASKSALRTHFEKITTPERDA